MKKALLGLSNGIRLALAVGAISLLASQQAAATNLFWSGNGTSQGGAGTWNTTTGRFATAAAGNPVNTYNVVWNNANIDSAEFGGTSGQVNLAGPLVVNLITTDLAGFNIGNANSAAALNRIDFQGANAGVFTNYAGGTTTLSALLTANNVVTKTGAGRMEMGNGSNPASVKFILKGGVVTTASIARFSATPAALVQDYLTFDGGGWAINTGSQTTGNRGITILSGGANFGTSTNSISITVDQPIVGSQGGGLNVTNAGPFSSANTSNGGGQLILTNSGNTYDGVTTITSTASKLSVTTLGNGGGASSSLGTSSSAAANLVLNGGTLAYIGSAAGSTDRNFTISATGGTLDASGTTPGSSAATFASTAAIALSGTGTRTLTLTGTNTDANTLKGALGNQGANATSVNKTGAGTWVMDNGANSYTGTTTLTLGTLLAGNNSAFGTSTLVLGNTTTGTLGTSGGARTLANTTQLAVTLSTLQPTNNLTFSGDFTVISGATRVLQSNTNTGTTTFSGNLFLSDASGTAGTLTLAGVATSLPVYTVSGTISNFNGSGTAGNIQIGNGSAATAATLNLTGTNTHSGETRLSTASFLNIGSAGALGTSKLSATGNGTFDNTTGGDLVLANGLNLTAGSPTYAGTANNLTLGDVQIIAANRSITVAAKTLTVNNIAPDATPTRNLTKGGAGKLVVKGTGSYTGTTTISAGVLQVGDGGTTGALRSGGVGTSGIVDNANLTINRSNAITQSTDLTAGVISGTGSLTQAGSGVLTLDGANIYSGGTTVSNGTLLANNTTGSATGSGAVTVNSGATLGGSGSIAGSVTSSGTLSPGNSPGVLTIGGNLSLLAGNYKYEIDSTPAAIADLTNVTGNLNITAGAVTLAASDLGSSVLAMGTKFTLFNYGGTWNGGTFIGLPNYSTTLVVGANRFAIRYNDATGGSNFGGGSVGLGSAFVTITAVPEATAFLTIGLGGIFAFAAVRMGKRMGFNLLKV